MRRYGSLIAVALGGAAGAVTRWRLVEAAGPDRAGLVVFALNVFGAAVVGVLMARRSQIPIRIDRLLGAGFAGGLTTFSAMAVSVARSLDEGAVLDATVHALGTMTAALLGAGVAYRLARPRR